MIFSMMYGEKTGMLTLQRRIRMNSAALRFMSKEDLADSEYSEYLKLFKI